MGPIDAVSRDPSMPFSGELPSVPAGWRPGTQALKATKARGGQPSPLLAFVWPWSLEPSPPSLPHRHLEVFSAWSPISITLWAWGEAPPVPTGAQGTATSRWVESCPGDRATLRAKSPPPPWGEGLGPSTRLPRDHPL